MSTDKRRIFIKDFAVSQFTYCHLVWVFHSEELNNRINSLNEEALRLTYQKWNSFFDELLNLDKLGSIHYRNFEYLLTEIYKVKIMTVSTNYE